ncbi:Levansucrase [Sphingomonas sp. S2M10]|uniref:glycoside hydrolase family 68 protein n=1 Tax=Sphingomonas sp. S2M10 TaxID=2705010 RepID=UPI0014567BCC|nr:glycoside hydrolase family 68 protein [Sphingomonas sp. S2M10]NLS26151.1 Levansucrase [Sphingomonas sp. S2M10]
MTARAEWTRTALAGIARQTGAAIPPLRPGAWSPVADLDYWDMWPIADADGRTVLRGGRSWWFFLAAPRLDDPEARHDVARIRLTSIGGDGVWRDHGDAFPDGFTPGSREWSGSAVLEEDGVTLSHYFTAAGRRGEATSFEQRLFVSRGRFHVDGDAAHLSDWSPPEEIVAADGAVYTIANETVAPPHGIQGFRDPGFFRDPADGAAYVLFTANAAWSDARVNGVIGVARRSDDAWRLDPPLLSAIDVNSELERPHIVVRDGRYYLFWSTQARRFATGITAPTGLYAMVAERMAGPWRPANGTGLVAANPPQAPAQAYCWWVTADGYVLSFRDYPGIAPDRLDSLAEVAQRRRAFGGAPAPFFLLAFDGDRVTLST